MAAVSGEQPMFSGFLAMQLEHLTETCLLCCCCLPAGPEARCGDRCWTVGYGHLF